MSESASTGGSSSGGTQTQATTQTAAATSSNQSSDASKTQTSQNSKSSQGQQQQGYNVQTGQSGQQSAKAESKSQSASENSKESEESFEEVTIGNVKAKVPKDLAKTIKDLDKGFRSKAEEAAQYRKLISAAKANPREFFKQTGLDPYAFAEEALAEKYEEMTMPAEQKRLRDLEKELNQYKSTEKQTKEQLVDQLKQYGVTPPENIYDYSKEEIDGYVRHQAQQYNQEFKNLDHEMGQAFSESGIPADKYLVAKVAFEIASAAKQNKKLSAKEALAKVTTGYYDGTREHLAKMDGKRIHEVLGDNVIDKIRKHDLETVNQKAQFGIGQQNGQGSNSSSQANAPKKTLNELEWRKYVSGE
jgi:hypothetical protein